MKESEVVITKLADWLNEVDIDCVLWLEKNDGSVQEQWYQGYKAAIYSVLMKLEQINKLVVLRD